MAEVIHFFGIWWTWINLATTALALVSVPSVLVRRRGRPMAAMSWLLCLLSVPILGLGLWWLIGRRHLDRKRRRKRHAHEAITPHLASLRDSLSGAPPSSSEPNFPLAHVPTGMSAAIFPPTGGNEVRLLDSRSAFDSMSQDVERAHHHVHALYYIWKDDETGRRLRDLLIDRARAGIEVRVLCDAVGSPAMAGKFGRPLRSSGAKLGRFLPPRILSRAPRLNFRNHRKILVVDGKVGIISGFNIANEYRSRWRDVGLRIAGPAVDQLQEIFADDWHYATGENLAERAYFHCWDVDLGLRAGADVATIASGPDTELSPIHDGLFVAMGQTHERLWVTTPYFIPSRPILAALRAACYRGVDVRIMLPALNDLRLLRYAARSYYPELLSVGVRIFEYQPAMLHSKVMVFDQAGSVLGSANLDNRSFRLNFEASCFVRDRELNRELAKRFEQEMAESAEIDLGDFEARPWSAKVLDAAANLFSPLL